MAITVKYPKFMVGFILLVIHLLLQTSLLLVSYLVTTNIEKKTKWSPRLRELSWFIISKTMVYDTYIYLQL